MLRIALTLATLVPAEPAAGVEIRLDRGSRASVDMDAGTVRNAALRLRSGQSAELVVMQRGIDVAVDVLSPRGALLDSVDSPNGRQGPEPISFVATESGTYRLRIRALAPNEPSGQIEVSVVALRSASETGRLLAERRRARDVAAHWLGRANAALPPLSAIADADALPPFDEVARDARIVGLGEASHGSRELNDFRLALVRRLVARHGYRLIALEDSAGRWRALEDYVAGRSAAMPAVSDWGWIGVRSRRALLQWVREWNLEHPGDPVRVIGVDAQDNGLDRALLGVLLARAYGPETEAVWAAHAADLAAADAQAAVFGNSGTSPALRQFMQEVVAQLSGDAALLRARVGEADYEAAYQAALNLAAFVDFNSGSGVVSHSRDWHMAAALLRAVGSGPGRPKAVYWAHNSHVSAAATRWGPTGALLRQALGCGYRAVASTFGAGALIAQVPGDQTARIAETRLAVASPHEERIETVLASIRPGAHFSAWPCGAEGDLPEWLRSERPLRWVGGLYAPNSPPSASYQPYRLTAAFDAIAYFPVVSAEEIPADRGGARP